MLGLHEENKGKARVKARVKLCLEAKHREMAWVPRTCVKSKLETCRKRTKCDTASRSMCLASRGRVSVRLGLGLS